MTCIKCGTQLPEGAKYCYSCGRKQAVDRRSVRRPNGSGSVYKRGKTWTASVVIGWRSQQRGATMVRVPIRSSKGGFSTRAAAMAYLPQLRMEEKNKDITFKQLYDLWLPTYRKSKSTFNCYKAAFKYFASVHYLKLKEIDIEDLQDCLDECPQGKRTKQNMKAFCGLLYKYGIPRDYIPKDRNLAQFLIIDAEASKKKSGFDTRQLDLIRSSVNIVPYADYIYCMCYLGFRPSEFLSLRVEDYDRDKKFIVGGAKTEAGTNRTVTISPKIQPIVDRLVGSRTEGPMFPDPDGGYFSYNVFRSSCFYPALDSIGIENPVTDGVHKYTPHCCRHTFATLMKSVDAPGADKIALIGHTDDSMLRYYQDVNIDDLRKITDSL